MIYFTADLHFGHKNIIKHCNRPFEDDYHMDKTLIDNWNNTVSEQDVIYVLGDFSLHSKEQFVYDNYISKLKGEIFFLYETHTHDKWLKKESTDIDIDIVNSIFLLKYNKRKFFCTHCPLLTWPQEYHGSYHLHGHSHGKSQYKFGRYDVGVDCNNYKPISIEQIMHNITQTEIARGMAWQRLS